MLKLILKMIGVEKLILMVWEIIEAELSKTKVNPKLVELLDTFVHAIAGSLSEVKNVK